MLRERVAPDFVWQGRDERVIRRECLRQKNILFSKVYIFLTHVDHPDPQRLPSRSTFFRVCVLYGFLVKNWHPFELFTYFKVHSCKSFCRKKWLFQLIFGNFVRTLRTSKFICCESILTRKLIVSTDFWWFGRDVTYIWYYFFLLLGFCE